MSAIRERIDAGHWAILERCCGEAEENEVAQETEAADAELARLERERDVAVALLTRYRVTGSRDIISSYQALMKIDTETDALLAEIASGVVPA